MSSFPTPALCGESDVSDEYGLGPGYGCFSLLVFMILQSSTKLLSLSLPEWMWLQSSSQSQIEMIVPGSQETQLYFSSLFYLCWETLG